MLENIDGKTILMFTDKDLLAFVEAFYLKMKAEQDLKDDEWIDADTAMSLLKVKSTTLYKLRSTDQIKISQFNKSILYSRSSIMKFIANNVKTLL